MAGNCFMALHSGMKQHDGADGPPSTRALLHTEEANAFYGPSSIHIARCRNRRRCAVQR